VSREGDKEYLQQRIGEQPRLKEDHEVEKIGEQHDWPTNEQAFGGKPDAEHCNRHARQLEPMRCEVADD
jgi:hypothetical protein